MSDPLLVSMAPAALPPEEARMLHRDRHWITDGAGLYALDLWDAGHGVGLDEDSILFDRWYAAADYAGDTLRYLDLIEGMGGPGDGRLLHLARVTEHGALIVRDGARVTGFWGRFGHLLFGPYTARLTDVPAPLGSTVALVWRDAVLMAVIMPLRVTVEP